MPSYDFEVDLQSLAAAAQGIAETVQLFKDKDVEDLVPGESALGSDVSRGGGTLSASTGKPLRGRQSSER